VQVVKGQGPRTREEFVRLAREKQAGRGQSGRAGAAETAGGAAAQVITGKDEGRAEQVREIS